ncbi:hypothetical protein KC842_01695 [Candidatus Nomurabacteria bacterium]|nr:hypothetical protein [Candidatus Nomurabacteria bacterium]USN94502.1 MAG: hypothetical protein H6791_01925 [Candidatus Nomurabacteria bacterium]
MRFILPILLIVGSVLAFVGFTRPMYEEIKTMKVEALAYDEALQNARELQEIRDALAEKYSNFNDSDLDRVEKLLPDNVDSIRLIIEIERIAAQYGMIVKEVSYASPDKEETDANGAPIGKITPAELAYLNRDYSESTLSFSTEGSYENFLAFLSDLESSLRVVDVTDVSFSSLYTTTQAGVVNDSYKYSFSIKTYWLKN